mgnify:CR=1 FL=1
MKGVLDVVLTLPLVLPPTVVGYLLLRVLGPNRILGSFVLDVFGIKIDDDLVVSDLRNDGGHFPADVSHGARRFLSPYDENLAYAGQTLGLSNTFIFWHIRMPYCKQGILAGTVLAFARALGEYGATSMVAGYTPGRTATISTTVYQLWRTNDDALAFKWVLVNLAISFVVLLAVNLLEKKQKTQKSQRQRLGEA